MEFTAIIRKGEKQFVALCPELDVVSQGYNIEEALKNLKEACELFVEVSGLPEGVGSDNFLVTRFDLNENETAKAIRAWSNKSSCQGRI